MREALEKERHVGCFLYLTQSYELFSYLAGFYDRCAKPVYFGIMAEFQEHGLATMVLDHWRTSSVPLRTALALHGR